jgi:hypothetical protein
VAVRGVADPAAAIAIAPPTPAMDYKERFSIPNFQQQSADSFRLSHFRRIVNSGAERSVDIHRLSSLALTGQQTAPRLRLTRRHPRREQSAAAHVEAASAATAGG